MCKDSSGLPRLRWVHKVLPLRQYLFKYQYKYPQSLKGRVMARVRRLFWPPPVPLPQVLQLAILRLKVLVFLLEFCP